MENQYQGDILQEILFLVKIIVPQKVLPIRRNVSWTNFAWTNVPGLEGNIIVNNTLLLPPNFLFER